MFFLSAGFNIFLFDLFLIQPAEDLNAHPGESVDQTFSSACAR